MFEPPTLNNSTDSENKDDNSDPFLRTMGQTLDRNVFFERLDKLIEEKLTSLEIYGGIKTNCPAEYFLCNMLDTNNKFKTAHLIQMDHNLAEDTYSIEVSPMSSRTDNKKMFVPNQAHIWIPDE